MQCNSYFRKIHLFTPNMRTVLELCKPVWEGHLYSFAKIITCNFIQTYNNFTPISTDTNSLLITPVLFLSHFPLHSNAYQNNKKDLNVTKMCSIFRSLQKVKTKIKQSALIIVQQLFINKRNYPYCIHHIKKC